MDNDKERTVENLRQQVISFYDSLSYHEHY